MVSGRGPLPSSWAAINAPDGSDPPSTGHMPFPHPCPKVTPFPNVFFFWAAVLAGCPRFAHCQHPHAPSQYLAYLPEDNHILGRSRDPYTNPVSRRRTAKVVNYSEKLYDEGLEEQFKEEKEEKERAAALAAQPYVYSASPSTSSSQSPSKTQRGEGKKTSKQTTPENGHNTASGEALPSNWQPKIHPSDALTGPLDLEGAFVRGGKLHLADGTTFSPGEHCYIVSEPPGEPYYIGRIMDFVINEENPPMTNGTADTHWSSINPRQKYPASQFLFQVNWFYRPKDISKHVADSRLLYATMHSDVCPLQSMRGKCVVTHRTDIIDMDDYRVKPNHFYFAQFYDRYILRFYEIVPTHTITNVPKQVYDVLTQRFQYAIMEINRKQEFCEDPKECVTCANWSSPDDSVECAHCRSIFHMMCVTPPLFKKPTRGFGWSCAACNRKVEKRLKEAKGEFFDDVIPEIVDIPVTKTETSPSYTSRSTSPDKHKSRFEELEEAFGNDKPLSNEQKHQLQLWPFRYLGVYAKIEDVLDVDDRIYPRAVSRLGPKHQAVVEEWPGQPVEYFGPFREALPKKRGKRKGDDNFTFDPKKPWIQERPIGYIERGGPDTAMLMWDCNAAEEVEKTQPDLVVNFLEQCAPHAEKLGVRSDTPNYFDLCLKALMDAKFDTAAAFKVVKKSTAKTIGEPVFTAEDKRRFEDGVSRYGSELHPVTAEVQTQTAAAVVRYYYMWKKTPSGRKIWGNYPGRKHKKGGDEEKKKKPRVDLGDDSDGSAYDSGKATKQKKSFECKHCLTTTAPSWRRAPGGGDDEGDVVHALCQRCARLWRRYAVLWEDPDEMHKKLTARGGKLWAKKVEAELLDDTQGVLDERVRCSKKGGKKKSTGNAAAPPAPPVHIPTPREAAAAAAREEKKRLEEERKAEEERERQERAAAREREKERREKEERERKDKERKDREKRDKERKEKDKKLKEERKLKEDREAKKRKIDDEELVSKKRKITNGAVKRKEELGLVYRGDVPRETRVVTTKQKKGHGNSQPCHVCGVSNEHPVVGCGGCQVVVHRECYGISADEPQLASSAWFCDLCTNDAKPNVNTHYQCILCPIREGENESTGNKLFVPDPLKRTENNHWAHIRCCVWNPRLSFGTRHMEPILGVAQEIRYTGTGICFICKTGAGVCVTCRCCGQEYHAGCGYKYDYVFGFEFVPASEDVDNGLPVVEFNGRSGVMIAVTYCFWHAPTNVIAPAEMDNSLGKSALQMFIESYKVDHSWSPCAADASVAMQKVYDVNHEPRPPQDVPELNKICIKCNVGISPCWRPVDGGFQCQKCHHGQTSDHADLRIGIPSYQRQMRKLLHFDVLYKSDETYRQFRDQHKPPMAMNNPPNMFMDVVGIARAAGSSDYQQ